MKLDREYQKEVLTALAEIYPSLGHAELVGDVSEEARSANLYYLAEHGLITDSAKPNLDSSFHYQPARITKDGMDFLAEDGGLSAILGVVTIKLHEDTIKSLIESKIMESDLPAGDKPRFVDALRSLPADATKHLTMKLLDLALSHAPGALHAVQTALHIGS
ncbi:hypothetical protein WS75_23045 [Burkholderia sp. FL-7-2-10-S1-D7]|uniref:hypothetical protein n=1 Tax=Burkholderia sp. FL-7-2-10-S1-D7 TaxID=1637866 RepID=UPI0007590BB5|nr:hypothetical protein [Burkholderia sp. FL-7-2-10-S1-D7]KVF71052.1 hypothetical protein WS75_23045 [Burkholderia sp. FL-7-2-10-S1-D7]